MRLPTAAFFLLIPLVFLGNSTDNEGSIDPPDDTVIVDLPVDTVTLESQTDLSLTTPPRYSSIDPSEYSPNSLTTTSLNDIHLIKATNSSFFPEAVNGSQLDESSLNETESSLDSAPCVTGYANQSVEILPFIVKKPDYRTIAPIQQADDSLEKRPIAVESDGTVSESTPEGEEDVTLEELKNRWDAAAENAKKLNISYQEAKDKLSKKEGEALRANQTYEAEKKKWEELVRKVQEQEEAWSGALTKAQAELDIIEPLFKSAEFNYTDANAKLIKAKEDLAAENLKLEEINGRPERLKKANANKTDTTNRQGTVEGEKKKKEPEYTRLFTAYDNARKDADTARKLYNDGKCDEFSKKDTPECKKKRKSVTEHEGEMDTKTKEFKPINDTMSEYDKELGKIGKELIEIGIEITSLVNLVRNQVDNLRIANNDVAHFNGEIIKWEPKVKAAEPIYNEIKPKYVAAVAKRDEAQVKVDAGEPDELKTAKQLANEANGDKLGAGSELKRINGEVKELATKLPTAEGLFTAAQSDAKKAEERYTAAKRKDDESKRGVSPATIGIAVSLVLLAIVGAASIFFCWHKHLLCFKTRAYTGVPTGKQTKKSKKSNSRTPSTSASNVPADGANQPMLAHEQQAPAVESAPADGQHPPGTVLPNGLLARGTPIPGPILSQKWLGHTLYVNVHLKEMERNPHLYPEIEGVHYHPVNKGEDHIWKPYRQPDPNYEGPVSPLPSVKKPKKISFEGPHYVTPCPAPNRTPSPSPKKRKKREPKSDDSGDLSVNKQKAWEKAHLAHMRANPGYVCIFTACCCKVPGALDPISKSERSDRSDGTSVGGQTTGGRTETTQASPAPTGGRSVSQVTPVKRKYAKKKDKKSKKRDMKSRNEDKKLRKKNQVSPESTPEKAKDAKSEKGKKTKKREKKLRVRLVKRNKEDQMSPDCTPEPSKEEKKDKKPRQKDQMSPDCTPEPSKEEKKDKKPRQKDQVSPESTPEKPKDAKSSKKDEKADKDNQSTPVKPKEGKSSKRDEKDDEKPEKPKDAKSSKRDEKADEKNHPTPEKQKDVKSSKKDEKVDKDIKSIPEKPTDAKASKKDEKSGKEK